jgi:hypothetical protein
VVVSRRFESDKIKKKIKIQANKSGTEIWALSGYNVNQVDWMEL